MFILTEAALKKLLKDREDLLAALKTAVKYLDYHERDTTEFEEIIKTAERTKS